MNLKRGLNLPLLLLYGVGNILGAGIYVLVGEVAEIAGYHAPVSFLLAAAIAGITGFTYIELSTRYPVSAGEAVYVEEGFSIRWITLAVGLLVCASGIVSSATLARGFVGYLDLFLALPDWLVILALIWILALIAVVGISESVTVASIFTVLEVIGLLVIIWVSRDALLAVPEYMPRIVPDLTPGPWLGVVAGAFLSFFAFIGFEDMVNVAEEVKEPHKTLPRAIIAALVICSLLYGLIALVAVILVTPSELAETGAPLASVYQSATGKEPVFIGLLGLCAIVNGILIQVIMVSRILYGMANRGWIWSPLATVSERTRTPINATLLVAAIISGLALTFSLVSLAAITSLVVLIIFSTMNAALIAVKRKHPLPDGAVAVPVWVPYIGLAGSVGLALVAWFQAG